jgi:hypothetical protein
LKNVLNTDEISSRVYCAILELGSDSIQVENSVISPFYTHFLYTVRQEEPNLIILLLLFHQYKNISITKFSTSYTRRSIILTTSSQYRSPFGISDNTCSNIFQLSQFGERISSSTIFMGLFYVFSLVIYFYCSLL